MKNIKNTLSTYRINKSVENPKDKDPFYERIGIWGYTIGAISLGVGLGGFFGAFSYSLIATTDEKLIADVAYYKEERNKLNSNVDTLKFKNQKLLSENKMLKEQVTNTENQNIKLNKSLSKVNEEFNDYKATNYSSTSENHNKIQGKTFTSKPTEINLNESVSLLEGKVNIAVNEIYQSSTDIQISGDGYDSKKFSGEAGSQFLINLDNKYQVRIVKIDYGTDKIVVQAKKL